MLRLCEDCNKSYDDVYRLTYCPHDSFEMRTQVYAGGVFKGTATTIEQLRSMMKEKEA